MTVVGNLRSAMQMLSRFHPEELGGLIAIKVLKDQMEEQQRMVSELTQAGLHYSSYDNLGNSLSSASLSQVDIIA